MWQDFGFRESPYTTEPVPPTEEGDQLLVGREEEISKLERRITAGGNHPTIEGDNGIGKTSLLRVACYRLRREFEEGRSNRLFLPIREFFQPTSANSVDEFVKRVYFAIAAEIVDSYELLKKSGRKLPNVGDVETWLRSPVLRSVSGSASVLGFGAGGGRGESASTTAGFVEAGFRQTIDGWLRQLFGTSQAGGFICVIDNLELAETTQEARYLLEAIRDPLLNRRGLHWILCGARGIVRTSVASPRLDGRLMSPIQIDPISDTYVAAAIKRRIDACRLHDDAEAPVGPDTFRGLYDILNRNLRNAFNIAEEFAFWLVEENLVSGNADEYAKLFEAWLTGQADEHHRDTELGQRAWRVFDELVARNGCCSPGDFTEFGFNSMQGMRPHVKALEDQQLVVTSVNDEADKRRKTISVAPRGWLVRYARAGYRPPEPSS